MAKNTTPTADPTALLALARTQLAWRISFHEEPERQDARVQEQARQIVLYESEIGKSAVRIGEALDVLLDELEAFVDRWPNGAAAQRAALAALTGAGLSDMTDGWDSYFNSNHFACTVDELTTWLPMLRVMRERTEECTPPDTAMNTDEWGTVPRNVA